MQALQLTVFFFLPSILLSGFMFPYRGMPVWAQWFGEIFPLTHFIRIVRAVMLKGANLDEVGFEASMLGVFIAAYAGVALLRFRRTLD
jgi:ABC-2 type transport system permease protein